MLKLKIYKSLWGMTGTASENLARISKAGYEGVEGGLPEPGAEAEFRELLKSLNLEFIPMIFTQGPDHLDSYQRQLERAMSFKPKVVTSHSGRDSMELSDQLAFFGATQKLDKKLGATVAHETHRGRAFFSPWNTARVLREIPELRINADFSHWCCVAESLLEDCEAEMTLACSRAIHIHGRVGYSQGPQVSDPSLPEHAEPLRRHQAWWSQIRAEHEKRGEESLSFTPEFGPVPYMQALSYGKAEEEKLWDICLWMAQNFRAAFESESRAQSAAAPLALP